MLLIINFYSTPGEKKTFHYLFSGGYMRPKADNVAYTHIEQHAQGCACVCLDGQAAIQHIHKSSLQYCPLIGTLICSRMGC